VTKLKKILTFSTGIELSFVTVEREREIGAYMGRK
jgi:hypothetical protein